MGLEQVKLNGHVIFALILEGNWGGVNSSVFAFLRLKTDSNNWVVSRFVKAEDGVDGSLTSCLSFGVVVSCELKK